MLAGSIDAIAPQHVAVVGEGGADGLVEVLRETSLPGAVVQRVAAGVRFPEGSPLAGKGAAPNGTAQAFVCIGPQCSLPLTKPDELREAIRERRAAGTD